MTLTTVAPDIAPPVPTRRGATATATSRKDLHSVRALYFALSSEQPDQAARDVSRRFLDESIHDTQALDSDLPATPAGLAAWIEHNTADVGRRYQEYLAERKAGGARRYFSNKSHALYFLKAVAPTKTVDGAWLYGLLRHWHDGRFDSLIRIYLEELGSGLPDKNHVVLFKKLLATHGCEKWTNLGESYFVQGALQLSLAHQAEHFLPELIGFNLGYEQLPLHLLITAYELNELGIDPYYFTLHVTVDNADTGHATNALAGLQEAWPVIGDGDRFYERVTNGYKLNMLGAGTTSVIEEFDLETELITILAEKSVAGKAVHSDYCRVAGRTVNDWLSKPEQIPAFLQSMEQAGWIKRHQDPEQSRFWNLLQGDRADMFGVFSAYELQVIRDWMTGDAALKDQATVPAQTAAAPLQPQRALSFKARQKLLETLNRRATATATATAAGSAELSTAPMRPLPSDAWAEQGNDFDHEMRQFEQQLKLAGSREETMRLLASLMSPAHHYTTVGLKATRLFVRMFD